MYERRHTPPLTTARFIRRMLWHAGAALALIAASLLIGMLGYRVFGHELTWIDAFLNASMILSGMGPVDADRLNGAGKLFAGLYALYSGLVFIAVMGILLTPVVHRVLHKFHWESGREVG